VYGYAELVMDLRWIQKYVVHNHYLGKGIVDVNALEGSPELAKMLSEVWEQGYSSGFRDGDGDSYVESQGENPYKTLKKN
jgi:hypothetical protein